MNQNDPDYLAGEYGSTFHHEVEAKKSELIKRLMFELDRDESEPGCGRDRDTIFRELNEVLGLAVQFEHDDSGGQSMTEASNAHLTDADLEDMGGRRCACGEPVFQLGVPNEQHCELDTK